MKTIAIEAFGGPEVLQVVERPMPTPSKGQALVAVEAVGVGFGDVMVRQGALAGYGFKEGCVPGVELAGIVEAVADGVDTSWIGRRVFVTAGDGGGGYAEYFLADAARLVQVPSEVSPAEAVAIGVNALVAHFGLLRAQLAPGERVLVRGAGGGIGVMTTQLASRQGAVVGATTSSEERGARLRNYGVSDVLDRSGCRPDGTEPDGFDVVIDVVLGPDMGSFFSKLNEGGRVVAVGMVGGPPKPDFGMQMVAAFQKSLTFSTFSLNVVELQAQNEALASLFAAATCGDLKPVLYEVFALEDAAKAHQAMESGTVFGKLVLAPTSGGER